MFKTIAIVVLILIVTLLIFAATKPDTFRVQRSASIKAPPERIFPLVNDLHNHGGLVALGEKGPYDEENPQRRPQAARAPYMSGTATRRSARVAWRSRSHLPLPGW